MPMWTYNNIEIKALVGGHSHAIEISSIKVVDDLGATIEYLEKPAMSKDIIYTANIMYKGRKVGKVIATASTWPVYSRAWKNFAWTLVLILISITLIILLIMPLLERFLDEPLRKLVNKIQRIASGQFREKLPAFPTVELHRIAEEVNFMADKIAMREQQLTENMRVSTILKTELGIAETIQRSMTATRGFHTARRVAQYYQPMEKLSGDWMSVIECDDGNTIYAIIGDVTGHGIPQGLVTMAAFGAIQTLRPLIQQNSRSFAPSTILNNLRGSLTTILSECELAMTASVLKIDLQKRHLLISNAGHPHPLLLREQGGAVKLSSLGTKAQSPLGFEVLSRTEPLSAYEDTSFELGDQDTICLFSDGLTEAKSKENRTFQRPLCNMLKKLDRSYSATTLLDHILGQLNAHLQGKSPTDDVCLLVIDTGKGDYEAVA